MPNQFVPVVTVGQTGTFSIPSEVGHGTDHILVQPDGAILFVVGTTVYRWLADDTPDLSFNASGHASLLYRVEGYPGFRGPTLQQDGKILFSTMVTLDPANHRLVVMRLNADGSIDTSFGTDGQSSTKIDTKIQMSVFDTKVLADGKILVVSNDSTETGHIVLTRFLANGVIDKSFGTDGFVQDKNALYGENVTIQADGKIIVTGERYSTGGQAAILRFNADGSRDASFDNVALPFGKMSGISAALVQPDGKLLVTGGNDGLTVVRLNADGSLDTSFARNGVLTLDSIAGTGNYLHLNDDGSILVGLRVLVNGYMPIKPAVVRLHSDGTLDTTFGEDGFCTVELPLDQMQRVTGMTVTGDGHILWAVEQYPVSGGTSTPLLISFDANGHLDTGFGDTSAGTSNSASYTQGYVDQFLNPHIHIGNQDQLNYDGLTVTLTRAGGANAADHFTAGNGVSFVEGAVLVKGVNIGTVTETAGALKLVFNTAAKPELVDIALQGIAYQNTGSFVNTQVVTINWDFSTTDGSTHTSTDIVLNTTDAPYWIDALLDRYFPGQTAAALRTGLLAVLGEDHGVNLQFAADGNAAPFSDAAQATIRKALDQLTSFLDLQTGRGGATVVAHHGSELTGSAGVSGDFNEAQGDIYLSSSPTQAAVLHSLAHLFGLQHGDLSSADAAVNATQELGVLDIAALQFLYGPSKAARAGDDTYQLSASSTNFIWDGAGKDTISAAGLTAGVTLHLEEGVWDYIGTQGSNITAAGQITINFGSIIENATGGSGNDKLSGNSEVNVLIGGAGDDVLTGFAGDDTLDGGAGIDTAIYSGKAASYVVSRTATGWSVKDRGGSEGTDQLTGIERLQFSDKFLALGDDAAQIYRLYQAAFNRTPDAGGLGYWLHAQESGASLRTIAADFQNGDEFKQLYNGATEEAFVTQLYLNVLHRAPDAAGLAYWADHLKTDATRLDVLLGFSESRENIVALTGVTDAGMAYTPFH